MKSPAFFIISMALTLCSCEFNGPKCYVPDLKIGMSADEVEAKCGKPSRIYADSYGKDQWVYGNDIEHYLYFRDGKLSSWQSPR